MLRALMAASVALTLAVAPAQAAEEINFGIISTESSSNLKKIWDPFLADMEKGTGLKINAFFASDYAGVIEGMRFKKVQIAWFGNKSAL
jgi:phosphonate transport system substrate-binding protein